MPTQGNTRLWRWGLCAPQ